MYPFLTTPWQYSYRYYQLLWILTLSPCIQTIFVGLQLSLNHHIIPAHVHHLILENRRESIVSRVNSNTCWNNFKDRLYKLNSCQTIKILEKCYFRSCCPSSYIGVKIFFMLGMKSSDNNDLSVRAFFQHK